nr:MAG TPA: Small, acid-soluble spore protein [Caudoviricetes sp.]
MDNTTDIVDVTELSQTFELQEGDTLLLIRSDSSGAKKCYRIEGKQFRGKSAYEVAKELGYEGTEEEWNAQTAKVANFDVDFDPLTGSIVITK